MAFYQVVLDGTAFGQNVKNVLWYRTSPIGALPEALFEYAPALAAEVFQNVMLPGTDVLLATEALAQCVPADYRLVSISTMVYNDVFAPVSELPHLFLAGQNGLRAGVSVSAGSYATMHANLEGAAGPGFGLPMSGHLKIGPVCEADVDPNGNFNAAFLSNLASLGKRLASDLNTTLPIGTFFPIRTRVTRVAGLVTNITYRDIASFTPRLTMRVLESRLLEA